MPDKIRSPQPPALTRAGKRNKKKRRGSPRPPELMGIDVELLPFTPPAAEGTNKHGWRLSRREVMVFTLGAFAGAFVTFVAFLLAHLGR
jgi:hypothetical protein